MLCNQLFRIMCESNVSTASQIRSFYATQSWSLAHFLHHFSPALPPDKSQYHSLVRQLLDKPGMLKYERIRQEFLENERLVIGVGWIWLVRLWPTNRNESDALLKVLRVQGARPPIYCPDSRLSCTPLLGVDLWEHAWVSDYGINREGYLHDWWETIRWDRVLPLLAASNCPDSYTSSFYLRPDRSDQSHLYA
jgi:superoxide dismutase